MLCVSLCCFPWKGQLWTSGVLVVDARTVPSQRQHVLVDGQTSGSQPVVLRWVANVRDAHIVGLYWFSRREDVHIRPPSPPGRSSATSFGSFHSLRQKYKSFHKTKSAEEAPTSQPKRFSQSWTMPAFPPKKIPVLLFRRPSFSFWPLVTTPLASWNDVSLKKNTEKKVTNEKCERRQQPQHDLMLCQSARWTKTHAPKGSAHPPLNAQHWHI